MRYVGSSAAIMVQSSGRPDAVLLLLVTIVSIRYRKDSLSRSRPIVCKSCSGSSRFTVFLAIGCLTVVPLSRNSNSIWWQPIIGLT